MALKARITKVSRNVSSPQVDIEVTYFDDQAGSFSVARVFTFGEIDTLSKSVVNDAIQAVGKEYRQTLTKEDSLKTEFEGKEIEIV